MRSNTFVIFVVVCVVGVTTGCSSTDEDKSVVGAEGGTVEVGDRAALKIPTGALADATEITVAPIDDLELPKGAVAGTAVELGPDTTFTKPVELTLTYDPKKLPRQQTRWLRVVQLLDDGRIATTELVAIDSERHRITARLAHFSRYVVMDMQVAGATVEMGVKKIESVDVLFVVDGSPSMKQKQQGLAASFPKFIAQLESAGLDYRVGVITPDLGAGRYSQLIESCSPERGDGAKLRTRPAETDCPKLTDPWIERRGDRTNVPGDDVARAFSCIARVGAEGCGFEQPLEAMRRALDPERAVNPGFLRDDAGLAVVFITDEDDCSAEDDAIYDPVDDSLGPLNFRCFDAGVTCDVNGESPGPRNNCRPKDGPYLFDVGEYVRFLRRLKPNGALVVAAVGGPREPVVVEQYDISTATGDERVTAVGASCAMDGRGEGFPAIRLGAVVDAFGNNGQMSSICDAELDTPLDRLGELVVDQQALSWCLSRAPEDNDPLQEGIQADCAVSSADLGDLSPCAADGSEACYEISSDTACRGSGARLALRNAKPADLTQPVSATCLIP